MVPYLTLGKNQTIYIHVTPYFMSTLMSETRTKDELFSAVQTRVTDAATRLTWEDKTDRGNKRDNSRGRQRTKYNQHR